MRNIQAALVAEEGHCCNSPSICIACGCCAVNFTDEEGFLLRTGGDSNELQRDLQRTNDWRINE